MASAEVAGAVPGVETCGTGVVSGRIAGVSAAAPVPALC